MSAVNAEFKQERNYPSQWDAIQILRERGKTRDYALGFNPPLSSYYEYVESYLPTLVQGYNSYNGSALGTEQVLKTLFPHLKSGELPDPETASKTLKSRAKAGRPDSISFNPPYATYYDYFDAFLPSMVEKYNAYNRSSLNDPQILKVLFPSLQPGTFPDRDTALLKFRSLEQRGRPYAVGFNPPEPYSDTAYYAYFESPDSGI